MPPRFREERRYNIAKKALNSLPTPLPMGAFGVAQAHVERSIALSHKHHLHPAIHNNVLKRIVENAKEKLRHEQLSQMFKNKHLSNNIVKKIARHGREN